MSFMKRSFKQKPKSIAVLVCHSNLAHRSPQQEDDHLGTPAAPAGTVLLPLSVRSLQSAERAAGPRPAFRSSV